MRGLAVLIALLTFFPSAGANGHADDAQGDATTAGDLPAGRVGCNDLAADVRSLDVLADADTLTLRLRVWDAAGTPSCNGVPLLRSRLDHSMLVQNADRFAMRVGFDYTEEAPPLGVPSVTACGHVEFTAPTPAGSPTALTYVRSGCLGGVTREGDATTFSIPIHGSLTTQDGTYDYDFRGRVGAWTLGYTHSYVGSQLFCQDEATTSADT